MRFVTPMVGAVASGGGAGAGAAVGAIATGAVSLGRGGSGRGNASPTPSSSTSTSNTRAPKPAVHQRAAVERPAREAGEGSLSRALRVRVELLARLQRPRQVRPGPELLERQLVPVEGQQQPVGEQRQLARLVWL